MVIQGKVNAKREPVVVLQAFPTKRKNSVIIDTGFSGELCLSPSIIRRLGFERVGREAYVLADKMSQSWLNFAKTGNPNHAGLPKWDAYTGEKGTTMFFDNKSTIRFHHDEDLMKVVAQ